MTMCSTVCILLKYMQVLIPKKIFRNRVTLLIRSNLLGSDAFLMGGALLQTILQSGYNAGQTLYNLHLDCQLGMGQYQKCVD